MGLSAENPFPRAYLAGEVEVKEEETEGPRGAPQTFFLSFASSGVELGLEISDRPDAALVRDAMSGQPEAFNVLVRRWERKVYSFLVYLTGRPEDAFDMCQEVFLSGYRHLGQLKDPHKFPQWLFRIARNTAHSHARREHEEETSLKDLDPAEGSSRVKLGEVGQWERGELKILVERALAGLPLEQREAIVLKFYQGFKLAEIAEIQGCPLSTAKTRVYSGFEQLRKFIEG
jgi:RNA polymerase sigma-70 factor (ECF subfamily)